jgi:hypothetical protein
MQKVFQTERSREDSERYIYKLKKCEDPTIKSPTSTMKVMEELKYELSKMKEMKRYNYFKQMISRKKRVIRK